MTHAGTSPPLPSGLLQRVIVRGVERHKIFLNDEDRKVFLTRVLGMLVEPDTDCFV